jgi:hypothetical protein
MEANMPRKAGPNRAQVIAKSREALSSGAIDG